MDSIKAMNSGKGSLQVNRLEPYSCLSEVELFQDLSPADMNRLNAMLPLQTLPSGQIIYDPNNPQESLFIIKTGRVRIFQLSSSGKALTLSILTAGSVFGQMTVLGQNMGNSYAEALEEVQICRLNYEQVSAHFLGDSRIAVRVSQILGRKVTELETRLADLALRPLPARLASLLLQLTDTSFNWGRRSPVVRLTHEQLAQLAGATRESVSKVLANFADMGIIRQGRGRISLIDLPALRDIRDELSE